MSRARVIKSGQPRAARRRPSPTQVLRARDLEVACEREELLGRARSEAARVLEEARSQAAALQAGAREAAERDAARVVVGAQRLVDEQLSRARHDLTRLAVGIAEKILGTTLRLAPEAIADVVTQVLRVAGQSRCFVARVHPEDLPLLEARRAQLQREVGGSSLELRADLDLPRGGCILETDRGVVDGRVEVQLATLAGALFEDADRPGGA